MDRRDTLKTLLIGSVAGGAVSGTMLAGCQTEEAVKEALGVGIGRTPFERERDANLMKEEFLTAAELGVVATLCDIILPASDTAGSASAAEVPEFINFIAKDIPDLKIPIRGGVAWMNNESLKRFGKSFTDVTDAQQIEIVEDIAYPDKASEDMKAGVNFFNRMRGLTLTGYYTTKMGLDDLGYVGNRPNAWDGVPQDVLDKHGMSYDQEWLAKCVDQDKRNDIAEWDEQGNLLT